MKEKDQYITPDEAQSGQEATNALPAVVHSGYTDPSFDASIGAVEMNNSTSYLNHLTAINKLSSINSTLDSLMFANNMVNSIATSAVSAIHSVSSAAFTYANHYKTGSAVTAASLATMPAVTSAISMASRATVYGIDKYGSNALFNAQQHAAGSAITAASLAITPAATSAIGMASQAAVYSTDKYGMTALLNPHLTSGTISAHTNAIEMATCYHKLYGGGSGITEWMAASKTPGSICSYRDVLGMTSAAAGNYAHRSLIDYIHPKPYAGCTAHSLISTCGELNGALSKSASGAIAVSKAMNHKWYGGGEVVVDHMLPESFLQKSVAAVSGLSKVHTKSKYYGGGEAVAIVDSDHFARAINNDYDHHVVNQKRDAYKSILDNFSYDANARINLRENYEIVQEPWSYAVHKISDYVSVLDSYIATKDTSLLQASYYQEWEAMAFGYFAGFATSLEAFYERAYSNAARNKYERRVFNAIVRQRCKIKYKLDLRIIFRNIIRFLFKNMDDEPSESNVEAVNANNIFSLKNSNPNARIRNINSAKHAA